MPNRDPKVEAALQFQKLSAEAFGNQRQRENDDLEFQVPEKQWPEDVRVQRGGQTVNGVPIPARPMLSIPKLDQPIQITYNQWLHAHYGVQIHPLDPEADDETAKIIQGLYRSIEVDSRANLARGWGFDRGIKAGFGAYRVNVEYDESTEDPDDLKVTIKRILRQSSVYWDPFAVEPDFGDQTRCLIVSFVSRSTFQREFPRATVSSMSNEDLLDMQSQMPNWSRLNSTGQMEKSPLKWYDGENDTVAVAEYFYTDWEERQVGGRRGTRKVPVIKWCKINAMEVLEEQTWNGKYIPIIPCIGKELQPFDTERRWTGMIGPNKDSARLFNYEVTAAVEKDALSTKAPWIGAVGQFRTNNAQWQLANVRNLQYLEYDPMTAAGTLLPPPQRNLESPDLSSAVALIQIANENIQAGTALFDPSLGKQDSRAKSGKAIQAEQSQGDLSQSHYLANMADISMTYESKVVIDLICGDRSAGRSGVYDRPGRIAHVLGEDDSRKAVMLNAPFISDPKTGRPQPYQPGQPPQQGATPPPKVQQYDLTKGKYGVVVSVGKAYQTRAQEGSDALTNLIQADPQLMIPLGPIWAKFQDWPGHTEVATVLKKMQPPQLQETDDNPADPEVLQQKLEQQGQMLAEVSKALEEATKLIQTDGVKQQAESQRSGQDNAAKVEIARLNAARDVEIERLKAHNAILLAREKARLDLMLQDDQQKHELGLSGADAATQEQLTRLGFGHDVALGAAGAADAEAQGERSHEQSLEASEHEARLQPSSDNGSGA